MSDSLALVRQAPPTTVLHSTRPATQDSRAVRFACIGFTIVFLALFLFMPLFIVFYEALSAGLAKYLNSLQTSQALAAIRLTLIVALISVPVNIVFGIAAAWCIAKYRFPGRAILQTLVDLPLSVSPVVAGLMFVLVFGAQGWLGPWLAQHGLRVIFDLPGIVLTTMFITCPFVARELLPLMQSQGDDEEYAALTLGASGVQTFFRVTLPKVKWGLLYGAILCNARAMGEFGAVSVVSGHVRGLTNTLPLHVEVEYNEYHYVSAFACASLLAFLALVTLFVKSWLEWRHMKRRAAGNTNPLEDAGAA